MKLCELKALVSEGRLDADFAAKCGITPEMMAHHRERVIGAAEEFGRLFDPNGERDVHLFSVGGRSEISGNHTDHNHGRVIAASINLDIIAIAAVRDDGVVTIKSEGFPEDVVAPEAAEAPDESKFFTSASIIAGMERALLDAGYKVGGYDAYTTSNVLKGSGLSSSAAFEVMVGNIFSHLYNDGRVDNVEIAKMSQFAENKFFGKPCGLMDQTACAVGGFITIDFEDPTAPVAKAASLRGKVGDRALLRALHFIAENDRVSEQVRALEAGDIRGFLDGVIASGNSSYKYLQNVFTTKNVSEQGLSLALCLTEQKLAGTGAAWRVHGGGFAGTIQAFVPTPLAEEYREYMDSVFGDGACHILSVRLAGAIKLA